MWSIIKHYKLWFGFSGVLIIASIVFVILWGLNTGIDFRGGTLLELRFNNSIQANDIRSTLTTSGYSDAIVQQVDDKDVLIKTRSLSQEEANALKNTLAKAYGESQEIRFDSIGPTIGKELVRKAYWQVVLVTLGIILYIAYAFRKVREIAKHAKISSWRMGLATVIALIHDLIITVGAFALLGHLKGVEIDTLFVTALLTILGFSVHDTIVVFDRIRESLQKYPYKSLDTIIDYSIVSTMARSINTSSTLIFVLIALLLFGGETIFYFNLALLIGVTAGTYSSIFIASPMLHVWGRKE